MSNQRKKLYEYDIKSGHYIRINEDDNNSNVTTDATATNNTTAQNTSNLNTQTTNQLQPSKALVNAEKEANTVDSVLKLKVIQTYTEKIQGFDKTYDKDLTTQKLLLAASDNAATSATDAVTKSKAQLNSLLIKKTIADIELKHSTNVAQALIDQAKELYKLECVKLEALLKGINSDANESYKNLPKKYRNVLNESNIHQAKIYMNNLVVNDDEHIIKDMRDFKRAFSESDLIYGKDKKGFFVICIDQEDFNKLYATLQGVGYMRDDIFANVMPLVLDRSNMINIDNY